MAATLNEWTNDIFFVNFPSLFQVPISARVSLKEMKVYLEQKPSITFPAENTFAQFLLKYSYLDDLLSFFKPIHNKTKTKNE